VPYIIKDEVFAVLVARVDVVMSALLSAVVDPLNAAPGTIPLIELTLKVSVESV
jgi:hypothetical protein